VEHLKYNFTLIKIICKDYTVSGESFELRYDSNLDMYHTFPQPNEDNLSAYYKSTDYISHTDANNSLLDRIYQLVKKYAIRKKVALMESFQLAEKNILDIGCGTGDFLSGAKNRNWQVYGVEPSQQASKLAKVKLNDPNIILKDISDFKKKNKPYSFDVITMWHVLEHIPDFNNYIDKIKTLLKKDGYLVVAVPNHKSYDAKHYKEFWAAYDVPRHLWHFSQKSIEKIFNKHQMQVIKVRPMYFDAFYVSLLSEKYKKGKSNYIAAFWNGFVSNWKARNTKEYSSLIYIIKNR